MKVLIAGAGPTGLTAALELARQGILPEIIEKRTAPSELSRAVGIMPISIDRLRPSGAGNAIENESMVISKVNIYRGTKRLLDLDFSTLPDQPVRTMLALPQNRTESLMAEALEKYGVTVQYGCELISIETGNQQANVEFNNQPAKTYDWVIAADGKSSRVREQLGIDFPGVDLDEDWSIADVEVSEYDFNMVSLWIQGEQNNQSLFSIIIPIEKNRVRVVSNTNDALAALPIALKINKIRRTGTFQISIRQATTYKKHQVLLAGDAAHCHSPVGGRGMNLGIEDAVAAARAIINGTASDYSESRHAVGKKVLTFTEDARKFILSKNPLNKLVTSLAFNLVNHSQYLQKKALHRLTTF